MCTNSIKKEVTIMSRLPPKLEPEDFFKILEKEPQEITIKNVRIEKTEEIFRYNILALTVQLVETQQTCTYGHNISYNDSSKEYYIGMSHKLYPLLACESGIENNALIYTDDEFVELLTGLRFKATGKTKVLKSNVSFTLIPLTEKEEV